MAPKAGMQSKVMPYVKKVTDSVGLSTEDEKGLRKYHEVESHYSVGLTTDGNWKCALLWACF